MSNVLAFIQDELKTSKRTMTKFLEDNKLNRSSFYRLMNEPVRINQKDIDFLSNAMGLSETRKQEFCDVIRSSTSGRDDQRKAKLRDLFFSTPEFIRLPETEVELYSLDDKLNRTIKGYYQIVDLMKLKKDDLKDEKSVAIKIKIKNCLSTAALSSLYIFISELRKVIDPNLSKISVTIEHIISVGKLDKMDRAILPLALGYMVQFSNYAIYYIQQKGSDAPQNTEIFDFLENTIAMRIEYDGNKESDKNQYYVFNISNVIGERDYCFHSDKRNYYGLHRAMFNKLKDSMPSPFPLGDAPAQVNAEIAKFKDYKRILHKNEPCIDSMPLNVWESIVERLFCDLDNGEENEKIIGKKERIKAFRAKYDPNGAYDFWGDKEFYENQVKYLDERFKLNESPGSVNIYSTYGFGCFIKTGILSDIYGLAELTETEKKMYLDYLIDHIEKHYGDTQYQQFYFQKSQQKSIATMKSVFAPYGVMCYSERCPEQYIINLMWADPEVSEVIYDVITQSLTDEIILSKEETLAFLGKLYNSLGEE